MSRHITLFLGLVFILCGGTASGKTLTAMCKEPVGRVLGYSQGERIDQPDAMTNGQVILTWEVGEDTARIVTQGSGGENPLPATGVLVHQFGGQISFAVNYPAAFWVYSFYLKPEKLLMTKHTNALSGGLLSSSLLANCEMSLK